MDIDTETYGGACPFCGCPMFQKGCHSPATWYRFDACPWCGYAHSLYGRGDSSPEAIFASLLQQLDAADIEKLRDIARSLAADNEFFPTSVEPPDDPWNHLLPVPAASEEDLAAERQKVRDASPREPDLFDELRDRLEGKGDDLPF